MGPRGVPRQPRLLLRILLALHKLTKSTIAKDNTINGGFHPAQQFFQPLIN